MNTAKSSPLGKATDYPQHHAPELLFPIARQQGRKLLSQHVANRLVGQDIWHAWELSWLNPRGKPCNSVARFTFDCQSPALVESKSFKLYLGSLSQTRFDSREHLAELLTSELTRACGAHVGVTLLDADDEQALALQPLTGQCIDNIDTDIHHYGPPQAQLLRRVGDAPTEETLVSHLFRSNCPVTGQPDWASIQIHYRGVPIEHASLLRYLCSYRNHSGFHEQCVENIHVDIMERIEPKLLNVYACFTRRGGLDINPWRSTHQTEPPFIARETRQ